MIRPQYFYPNPDTAVDNAYQKQVPDEDPEETAKRASSEVDHVAEVLREKQIRVHLFEDTRNETPDSVFPNNWFSTHPGGHIAIYPMFSANRRRERRQDIIDMLKAEYHVQDIMDYSGLEFDDLYLEGTGAMVLDHIERVAYTAESNRANPIALERFCAHFNYEPMAFETRDESGSAVYHTNVMMSIGSAFAVVGTELIINRKRRDEVVNRLQSTGREVIELSNHQIGLFAGNVLELSSPDGRLLALSRTAYDALTGMQRTLLERHIEFVVLDIPTIELAGGSIRCMLAGIHLARRS
ncbi:citrulline utilization hydrolase CtlX [Neptunomonas sp.]|uniref:citrulline utilization hydrolase CtlX n=1 Tax=Neptunomonas sp. TaxID=1971898 RepID=UPI00356698F4